ncbi:MAG TPA: CocE/NonD family hydrolase [Acidisoma sp.]|nr:CocE/NonD family hydrolase [Acidisoma sp.]
MRLLAVRLATCLAAGMVVLCLITVARASALPDFSLNPMLIPPLPMNQQVMMLPADPDRPAQLEVTLLTPAGEGPFPLAVVNHGAPRAGETPRTMPRHVYTFSAYYFLSRGYAVALPMMRGFALSEGQLPNTGCNLAAVGTDDARDILAIIHDLSALSYLDTTRVVVAGQSFGGWNTLAVGALHPKNVVALVNFNGGVRSTGCDGEASGPGDQALVAGAASLGGATRISSIWFYGDNDSIFPNALWRRMYAAYARAGGQATLVPVGRFRDDSHQLLSYPEGLRLWTGPLDAFLDRIGMPSRDVIPGYLPMPVPPATHFAALDDVAAVPNLDEIGRADYQHFLAHATPRVFVIGPDGQNAASYGGFDPLGRALSVCLAHGFTCTPYAVDDSIVWAPPPPPVSSHFAPLADVAAVPYLNALALNGYRKFLSERLPRAFVISPDGSWISASGQDPARHAMQYCRLYHMGCGIYAIDKTVVWRGPGP